MKHVHVMKKAIFAAILALLMLLPLGAQAITLPAGTQVIESGAFEGDVSLTGVVTLPSAVTRVESRAFAGTSLHGLKLPSTCATLGDGVLAGAPAAYVRLSGFTSVSGDPGAAWVFGPVGHSQAGSIENYVKTSELLLADGLYYHVEGSYATVLCSEYPGLTGEITIPKLVDDKAVKAVDAALVLGNGGATFRVPAYIAGNVDVAAETYPTMTAAIDCPERADPDRRVNITAEVTGAWHSVRYEWAVQGPDASAAPATYTTTTPELALEPLGTAGEWTITLTATDSAGDSVSKSVTLSVNTDVGETVYRAYVVGNTYPDWNDPLQGPDNDARAIRTMLKSMSATPYSVTLETNVTENGIYRGIRSKFANADANDVSLFYFSGHGASNGALVGTSGYVTPAELRAVLDEFPGDKIVLLDCCYSGQAIGMSMDKGSASPADFVNAMIDAFSWKAQPKGDSDLAAGSYHVMTACRGDQLSLSLLVGDTAFGVFTYGLCYGSGYDMWEAESLGYLPADANGDGGITISESLSVIAERIAYLDGLIQIDQEVRAYPSGDSLILWAQ